MAEVLIRRPSVRVDRGRRGVVLELTRVDLEGTTARDLITRCAEPPPPRCEIEIPPPP